MDNYLLQCDTLLLLVAVALRVIAPLPIGLVTKKRNKENTTFFALLQMQSFAVLWTLETFI